MEVYAEIIGINNNTIEVNIGLKNNQFINLEEYKLNIDPDVLNKIEVHDAILCRVTRINLEGNIVELALINAVLE